MTWFTRVLSCALAAAAALFAALVLTSSGPGHYGPRPWVRPTAYGAVAEEAERQERLEHEWGETDRAQRRRTEVLDAVIAGRCTLPEAAVVFWELNRAMPRFHWDGFRRFYPGATDGERCCRHVIRHVLCRLEAQPDGGAAVVRRLETELEELLRSGPVRLPGVAEGAAP